MLPLIGAGIIFVCAIGAFAAEGGRFDILIQPLEFIIIAGVAAGSYVIANRGTVLGRTTALLMSILSSWSRAPHSILERTSAPAPAGQTAPTPITPGNILDQLKQMEGQSNQPAAPAPAPASPAPAPAAPQEKP